MSPFVEYCRNLKPIIMSSLINDKSLIVTSSMTYLAPFIYELILYTIWLLINFIPDMSMDIPALSSSIVDINSGHLLKYLLWFIS